MKLWWFALGVTVLSAGAGVVGSAPLDSMGLKLMLIMASLLAVPVAIVLWIIVLIKKMG